MNRQHEIGPYWQDDDDWRCTIKFLPSDDPEGRLFAADIVGHLFGYGQLTNTRALALVGDSDASAYELLFSFSSPEEKKEFLSWSVQMMTWGKTTPVSLRRPPLKKFGMLVHWQRS